MTSLAEVVSGFFDTVEVVIHHIVVCLVDSVFGINTAGKQAGRQASRQAGKKAGKQTGKQADKQTGKQAGRQASRQAGKKAGKQTGKQADKQTGRQADRQASRDIASFGHAQSVSFDFLSGRSLASVCVCVVG